MKHLFTTPGCVILTLVFFALGSVIAPATASAGYRDQSDNLPGLHKFPTELVVIGGLLVVGAIVYAASKKHDRAHKLEVIVPAATESKEATKSDSTTTEAKPVETTPAESGLFKPEADSKLKLYFDAEPSREIAPNSNRSLDLSNLTLKAGIKFSF